MELDQDLCNFLAQLPSRHKKEYDENARNTVLQALFYALADRKEEYLGLLFPKRLPRADNHWKLSEAQGGTDGVEYTIAAKGKRCGHIFRPGEATYSCRTCSTDETCVLCNHCFHSSDHEAHRVFVSVSTSGTGCCDCGDPEAWLTPVHCSIHSPDQGEAAMELAEDSPATLPLDLQQSIRRTISQALDFICDVFSCAPEQMRTPKNEQQLRDNARKSRLTGPWYGQGDIEEQEYALILWNDEKHTMEEVAEQVAQACKAKKSWGNRKAQEVDEIGRSVICISNDLNELLRRAQVLSHIKVTISIRSARDTFREQMCSTIVDWLSDIAGCSVGFDHRILINTICDEMVKPWRRGSEAFNFQIARLGMLDHQKSEFEYHQRRHDQSLRSRAQLQQLIQLAAQNATEIPDDGDNDDDMDEDDDEDDEEEEEDIQVSNDDDDLMQVDDDMETEERDATQQAAARETADVAFIRGPAILQTRTTGHIRHGADILPNAPTTGTDQYSSSTEEDETSHIPPGDPNTYLGIIPRTPVQLPRSSTDAPKYWTECPPSNFTSDTSTKTPYEDLERRVRLDFLILWDLRFWKTMRNNLRHLYISTVITVPTFKRVLGLRLASIYAQLAQLYLIADREPDHSVIALSLQMLTTPSIAEEIVLRTNFLTRLFTILYTFMTKRQVGPPQDVDPMASLAIESGVLTNGRILHFFHDLKYLLEVDKLQSMIASEPRYLLQFLDIAKLLQGASPSIRVTGEHIEYESEAWIQVMKHVHYITRMSRLLCRAFEWRLDKDPTNICRAIRHTAKLVTANALGADIQRFPNSELKHETKFEESPLSEFDNTSLLEERQKSVIVCFTVSSEPMSFYHPLHYTLSWLIAAGRSMSSNQLLGLLSFSRKQLELRETSSGSDGTSLANTPNAHLLALFDIPLRVMVWMAQIRANMWVRNGATLKHQLSMYRAVGGRELSFQRDMFLLQVAVSICDPTEILTSMIERFDLAHIMSRTPGLSLLENAQTLSLLEDFTQLLISLLTDRALLLPPEDDPDQELKIAKQEIIQILCFKPMAYSDLTSKLPESLDDMDNLSQVLEKVAIFKSPEGLADSGLWQLKEEYKQLLNPYSPSYTRSQREESETIQREHLAKILDKPLDQVYPEPRLEQIRSGVFLKLGDFSQTFLFGHIVGSCLHFVAHHDTMIPQAPPTRVENFLQLLLHLILTAAFVDETDNSASPETPKPSFLDMSIWLRGGTQPNQTTLVGQLFELLESSSFSSSKPRVRFVLYHIRRKREDAFNMMLREDWAKSSWTHLMELDNPMTPDERVSKKTLALERQARVMASFKQQQNDFMKTQTIDWGVDDDIDVEDADEMEAWDFPSGNCIMCQEETKEDQLYGILAYLSEVKHFRESHFESSDHVKDVFKAPLGAHLDETYWNGEEHTLNSSRRNVTGSASDWNTIKDNHATFDPADIVSGPAVTGCGHVMHFDCFRTYEAAVARRHHYQIARNHAERIKHKEFICPLCKALGNAFLPVIWKPTRRVAPSLLTSTTFENWMEVNPESSIDDIPSHNETKKDYLNTTADTVLPELAHTFHKAAQTESAGSKATSSLAFPSPLNFISRMSRPSPQRGSSPEQVLTIDALKNAYERLQSTVEQNHLSNSHSMPFDAVQNFDPGRKWTLARSIGYTISAAEIAHRATITGDAMWITAISQQWLSVLRILSATVSSSISVDFLAPHDRKEPLSVLKISQLQICQLFGADHEPLNMPFCDIPALLSLDVFVFLAECSIYSIPLLKLDVHHLMRLCYTAEIVKVVLAAIRDPESISNLSQSNAALIDKSTREQGENFSLFIQELHESLKSTNQNSYRDLDGFEPNPNARFTFDQCVRHISLRYGVAFLRKAALLLHISYGVDFNLADVEEGVLLESNEFERLQQALRMPSIDEIITGFLSDAPSGEKLRRICRHWVQHLIVVEKAGNGCKLSVQHPTSYQLTTLPPTLDQLNAMAMSKRCPVSQRDVSDPCICLFCGEIFCGQAQCCYPMDGRGLGGCSRHRQKCGGNLGMFLNINKCYTLLHSGSSGSFFPAPYMDRHGESDGGRGRREQLFLHKRRYDKLFKDVWLNLGIPTAVARKLEAEHNTGGWETL